MYEALDSISSTGKGDCFEKLFNSTIFLLNNYWYTITSLKRSDYGYTGK